MRTAEALVVERRLLADGLALLWLSAPEISRVARPGQFVMARPAAGLDPFLPRAHWIHRLRDRDSREELALLIAPVGRGTRMLAGAAAEQHLQLSGPWGRPVALTPGVRRLLLIAEGISVAPLIWLADEESARGRSVTLVLVIGPDGLPYPIDLIRTEVEVVVVGRDEGPDGLSGLLPELAAWADQVVVSATEGVYRRLHEALQPLPFRRPCTVLLAPAMACGAGFCGSCAVAVRRRGMRLACVDGPAFELRDVV